MLNSSWRPAGRAFVFLAAALLLTTTLHSAAAEDFPLAIKGYDPVAYFMLGKPTPGLPAIEYNWDEHRYRFSSEEHRELFRADPVHYAPQFAQFCAMALSRAGYHGLDDRIDDWRAARAYARGYAQAGIS